MSESKEKSIQSEKILDAIAELGKGFDALEARFNKLETSLIAQFEAIRSDISALKTEGRGKAKTAKK